MLRRRALIADGYMSGAVRKRAPFTARSDSGQMQELVRLCMRSFRLRKRYAAADHATGAGRS